MSMVQPTNDDADGMGRPLQGLLLRGWMSGKTLVQRGRDLLAPSARCPELVADVTRSFAETSHQIYNNKEPSTVPRRVFCGACCPHDRNPRGSSVCRPDGEAETTCRLVALCGALWRTAGAIRFCCRSKKKPSTTLAHSCRYHIGPYLPSCGSEPCSSEKKAA